MLEIIPVLENLLFAAYQVVLAGWCRYLPVGPCNGWWPPDPGFLSGENPAWDPGSQTRTEWRSEEEPLWGRQIWLSDYLFRFHRKSKM